ncbi:MAG: hypothetical protein WC998_00475 [Candidatus Paceibacterota bacterium]|jgi:hypothetical protein
MSDKHGVDSSIEEHECEFPDESEKFKDVLPTVNKEHAFFAYKDGAGFEWKGVVTHVEYPFVSFIMTDSMRKFTLNLMYLTGWEEIINLGENNG